MLIVEGPDCIGKTTLVNALIKRLGELNGGIEPGTDHFGLEDSKIDTIDGYAQRIKPWTVSDRGWLSEVVYGETLRGKSNVNPNMRYILDGMQAAAGGFTVLVHANATTYELLLEKNWTPEEVFNKEDLRRVAGRFQNIAEALRRYGNPRAIMTVAVTSTPGGWIMWPALDRGPGDANPAEVLAGQYLQLYCELGAPEAK